MPAISLPAGFAGGLPVGMQLISRHFEEGILYRTAYTFEQNTDYHLEVPALVRKVD
jgi:aspartyl-tRNA(Asn)/glutamyl-tRNA(Gln) amidotransferase subunit A